MLSGLAVYKDRADPVALPDSEYPAWLWGILDDGSTTTVSGVTLESTAGMSKGEARSAQKRNMRLVRAAQRNEERERERARQAAAVAAAAAAAEAGGVTGSTTGASTSQASTSGAGMHAAGKASDGVVVSPAPGSAEAAQGAAATAVLTGEAAIAAEREQRRALRRANRESIKARNFVSG